MTTPPSTVLAPATAAYPKYAGLFGAIATLIATESPAPTLPSITPPVTTPPVLPPQVPPPPVTTMPPPFTAPAAVTLIAGHPLALAGDGTVCAFDFGDPGGRFNALRGYNAAHVYDTPGSFIATTTPAGQKSFVTEVTVVADPRPTVTLSAGDDLAAALAGVAVPTVVLLPPGAVFNVTAPIAMATDGVTLRAALAAGSTDATLPAPLPIGTTVIARTPPPIATGTNATTSPRIALDAAARSSAALATNALPATPASILPPCIRRIAAAGAYSTLIIGGADITIEGIIFDSDQPLVPPAAGPGAALPAGAKVGVYALNIMGRNLLVRNCVFANVDDGLHCQAKARGLVAIDCAFTAELRSCAVYLDAMQNVALLGLTAAGSINEHIIRLEGSGNVLVHGCDVNNRNGKEGIAIRSATNVAVVENTSRTWSRISQGTQAAPAIYCRSVLFAQNHFAGRRPDGPWLQINPGCQSVVIDGNTFDVDAQQVAIAVQAPTVDLRLSGNHLSRSAGVTSCRPLVDPFGNPAFTETGTLVSDAPTPPTAR